MVLCNRENRLIWYVCIFTSLVTFKPSEPFLVLFLECFKDISRESVIHDIFPVWTYSYLGLLPVLCAAAEIVGLRQIVVLGAACRLVTQLLVLWPFTDGSIAWMQYSQVSIAVGFAAHPALSAIMYRGVPRSSYAKAAGVVASVGVLAEVVASLLGQLLLSLSVELWVCFALSAAFTGAGVLFSFVLPSRQPEMQTPLNPGIAPSSTLGLPINGEQGSAPSDVADGAASAGASRSLPVTPVLGRTMTPVAYDQRQSGSGIMSDAAHGVCFGWASVGEFASRGRLVWADTVHVLRHSGAMHYYLWLSAATAVHHLIVTYWQAGIPSPPSPPPMPTHHNVSHCTHHSGESANGYTQAAASFLGGAAALLPMLSEKCLPERGCANLREFLIVTAPLALAALLYSMSVVDGCAECECVPVPATPRERVHHQPARSPGMLTVQSSNPTFLCRRVCLSQSAVVRGQLCSLPRRIRNDACCVRGGGCTLCRIDAVRSRAALRSR
jgi:hypothetical protein